VKRSSAHWKYGKIFHKFGTPHFPCGAHAFESPNPKLKMALKTT
jgi:hypothetical protein